MTFDIIKKMKQFIEDSNENLLFSIFFETNYPHFSTGLAILNTDASFTWIENSDFYINGLKEQYDFDSQGYGDMISIAAIRDDIPLKNLVLVSEDGELFAKISTRTYNKNDALFLLDTFTSDEDLIDFIKMKFLDNIDFNKSVKKEIL